MPDRWVSLTPKNTEKHGERILVNLARASSIWEHNEGTQIWFQAGHEDGKFNVQETLQEIEKLINGQAHVGRS